ncbi:MAG: pyruvate kinase [Crocinitomicaceae bacterium]|nr:pyruvate kinase [Crocinitomicaceae bacterium]|tara:strand:+ start:42309 stop:43739 length:1431 start_codon:yes stop_codon:yes gene_type:complete
MKYLNNKTKIIATIGPATSSYDQLKSIIMEGVNICRLNFSHGTYEDHKQVIDSVRKINKELDIQTGLLADLQGPKIRIGEIENGEFSISAGQVLRFTTKQVLGNEERVWINYEEFPKDVKVGDMILLDDGKIRLEVLETNSVDEVKASVVHGDVLRSKKGVNLPNTEVSIPCLTLKDKEDLDFILENDIPWVGLSFVRKASDVIELKEIIKEKGKSAFVISKIEKPEALDNLEAIIKESDGLMVARGDLGVEIPIQDVPLIQKDIVQKGRNAGKPIIIATQMMESMIENFSPTRAEVNDVANAVLDGADAVMLSGETSMGKFPVEVIKNMYKIVLRIEKYPALYNSKVEPEFIQERMITDSICNSAADLARSSQATGIVTMTFSGYTAFKTSSYRPNAYIYVFTANPKILEMLSLIWGVKAFYYDKFVSTDHTIDDVKFFLKDQEYAKVGDYVIHIASMPIAKKGMTNMLRMSHIR